MSPQQHGILVVSVLFLAITILFLLACLLTSAIEAAHRRREVRPHFEQVELARRAVARVEAERRRSAQCPRAGSAATPPRRRVA